MGEGIVSMYLKFLESILFWKNSDDHQSFHDHAVSDSEYAEELQVQEILEASLADHFETIYLQEYNNSIPSSSSAAAAEEEAGESSRKYCEICMEEKERNDIFKLESCSHCFCSDCVAKHVRAKIEDRNNHIVSCPSLYCDRIIEPYSCRAIIPGNVLARWEEAMNEASILESQKVYCPFRDCSAMLVDDAEEEEEEMMVITKSECPLCRRLFCAKCRVPWHQGFECEEFQELRADERGGEDDLMLQVLAKEKNWSKCPNCKFLVDKTEGCIHMTCRCGFEFCYKCGLNWTEQHWTSCQLDD